MNLLQIPKHLKRNFKAGIASNLVGDSGMGKSSVIYQTFLEWAAEAPARKRGFILVFAATMSPIEDMGVPFRGTRTFTLPDGTAHTSTVTDPTVPLWMLTTLTSHHGVITKECIPAFACDDVFWFCDEKDKAGPDTSRGLSEILLSGRNGYWSLGETSVRVSASNRGARYGSQKRFDFEISRVVDIHVDGNIDVTVNHWDKPYYWAGNMWQTMPVTKMWARTHSEIVFEGPPKEQGPWCNPRTICSFDRYLQVTAADYGGVIPLQDRDELACMTAMGAGGIGMPATSSFIATLQFKTELPQYEDVVKDPKGTPVPKKADLLMLMAYELAGLTKPDDVGPVLAYVDRMPPDMAMTFSQALLRRDVKNLINLPPMQAWVARNSAAINVIEALSR